MGNGIERGGLLRRQQLGESDAVPGVLAALPLGPSLEVISTALGQARQSLDGAHQRIAGMLQPVLRRMRFCAGMTGKLADGGEPLLGLDGELSLMPTASRRPRPLPLDAEHPRRKVWALPAQ